MVEFLSSYGLWIALAAIMIGMHWFGMGCCGGTRRHGSAPDSKGPAVEPSGGEESSGMSPGSEGGDREPAVFTSAPVDSANSRTDGQCSLRRGARLER